MRERGLSLREFNGVIAVIELREQLAGLYCVTFVNEDALDDAAFHGADDPALGRHHRCVRAYAHGPWNQNERRSNHDSPLRVNAPAPLGHSGKQLLLSRRERLQKIREGHLLIELRVADRDGGLIRKNGERLFMIFVQEIGFAAYQRQNSERSLLVSQGQSVKSTVTVLFQDGDDLRARLVRVEFPSARMKIGGDHLRLIRHPLETVAEIVHFARFRNFRLA